MVVEPLALEARPLVGSLVRLEPLSLLHVPALLQASSEEPGFYAWTFVPQTPGDMERYVETALEGQRKGHMLAYAIIRISGGEVVGCTRFYSVERWTWSVGHPQHGRTTPDACEIGYTWLARSASRTGLNTQAKRLLLEHAFEGWRVHRVSLRTDARNARSRAAIERIGGKLDGCLRCDRPGADGAIRDSAVYSITAPEWPAVHARLKQLEQRR